MHAKMLTQITAALVIGLCALNANAAPTVEATVKSVNDMVLDPEGFVHVAEDGIARSYAPNGTVIDYAPLSNEQLTNMVNSLPFSSQAEKAHVAGIFATVNGFAVKDRHQIFHPSTQLRPATNPAQTHWQEDTDIKEADIPEAAVDERYVHCKPTRCSIEIECVGMGCDVCIIAHDMSARYCHHGDF